MARTNPNSAGQPADFVDLRQALVDLPEGISHGNTALPVANVYLPRSHLKAMDPDVSVVVGMWGAGKTFGGKPCKTAVSVFVWE